MDVSFIWQLPVSMKKQNSNLCDNNWHADLVRIFSSFYESYMIISSNMFCLLILRFVKFGTVDGPAEISG